MKNSTKGTSIIKDIAVFDYVRGQQSEGARMNFGKLLEMDAGLLEEVQNEERLRDSLVKIGSKSDSTPVLMQNFDALLTRIERDDKCVEDAEIRPEFNGTGLVASDVVKQSWRWKTQFNIAASLIFFAMVGFIGLNQTLQPNFVTLSNTKASTDIDFTGLVDQRSLAKLELSDGLASTDVSALLSFYQLSSLQSGALGQTLLVSSREPIDEEQLSIWRADIRIKAVELVSFSND